MSLNIKTYTCHVTLKYNGKAVAIDIEPYKHIVLLREKCYELFYPISNDIKLIYQNKDLTENFEATIGDYFRKKIKIVIQIEDRNARKKDYSDLVNDVKRSRNIIYQSFKVLPDLAPSVNPSNLQKLNSIKMSNEKMSSLDFSLLKSSSRGNSSRRTNIPINNSEFCWECKVNVISHFCRTCAVFTCKNCQSSFTSSHKQHKTIFVKLEDLIDSIKFYQTVILSELNSNMKAFDIPTHKFDNHILTDPLYRQEFITRKLDKVENMYRDLLNRIPRRDILAIEKIHDKNYKITNEIENFFVLNKLNFSRRMSFDEAIEYFVKLHKNDFRTIDLIKDISSQRLILELNMKIDNMYKLIDKAIDSTLNFKFKDDSVLTVTDQNINEKNVDVNKKKKQIGINNEGVGKFNEDNIKSNRRVVKEIEEKDKNDKELKVNSNEVNNNETNNKINNSNVDNNKNGKKVEIDENDNTKRELNVNVTEKDSNPKVILNNKEKEKNNNGNSDKSNYKDKTKEESKVDDKTAIKDEVKEESKVDDKLTIKDEVKEESKVDDKTTIKDKMKEELKVDDKLTIKDKMKEELKVDDKLTIKDEAKEELKAVDKSITKDEATLKDKTKQESKVNDNTNNNNNVNTNRDKKLEKNDGIHDGVIDNNYKEQLTKMDPYNDMITQVKTYTAHNKLDPTQMLSYQVKKKKK